MGIFKESSIRGLSTASIISTLEYAGVGVWLWKASTTKVEFSEKLCQLFELDRSDSLSLESIESKIIQEDRDRYRTTQEKTRTDGTPNEVQYKIRLSNGSLRWISSLGGARFSNLGELTEVWGIVRDVSKEKETQQELRKRKAQFQSIFQSIPEAVFFSDSQHRIQIVNQMFIQSFGYELEEIEGEPIETFYANPDAFIASAKKPINAGDRVQKNRYEASYKRKNGSAFRGETVRAPMFDDAGEQIGFISVIRDIEHRKKREELLLRQTKLLKKSEEFSRVGHWHINIRSKELTWSDEVFRIHGLDKDTCHPTVETAINAYHPDDRAEVQRCVDESIATGEPYSFELRIIRSDGSIRNVKSMGECQFDKNGAAISLFGVIHDITESKRIENELLNKERRYRNLFNQSTDGILIVSMEGVILETNRRFCSLFGYGSEELLGKEVYMLHPESEREKIDDSALQVNSGKPSEIELICLTKFGRNFIARITPSIIEVNGKVFIQALFKDITEAKLAEAELRQAKERAEASDRLKSAFLANMSHEIRTPLNIILGFSQLLKADDPSREETECYIDSIFSSGRHLLNLIDDIIDIAQIESGQLKINPFRFDLSEMMLEAFSFFQNEVELRHQGKVTLTLDNVITESRHVVSDDTRLRQVIYNLLNNANKFTETGSISFGYIERANNVFEFYVTDTGVGIDSNSQTRIFDRFEQADDSLTRIHEGTGLGLTISKALIELLGGRLWVDSEIGRGSDFRFTLRLQGADNSVKQPTSASPSNSIIATLPPSKVLIVEDDQINFELLKGILKQSQLVLFHAKNGVEALEIADRETNIDLVLMDIKMPQMDGYEATRRLKQLRPDLPVIAQTAHAMADDRIKATESGCDGFLTKPIVIGDLAKLLSRHLVVN